MFISAEKKLRHTMLFYLGLTGFCGVFSWVYEYFSHQVYSAFMVYLFLFPLLGGVFPFLMLLLLPGAWFPCTLVRNAYHSGLATLTVGSCLSGIFEIYGTSVPLVNSYWIAGILLVSVGVLAYLAQGLLRMK